MKLVKDQFNSEIFKINMGNINLEETSASVEEIKNIEKKALADGYDHLTVHVMSPDKTTANNFFQEGFLLADTLVEFCFDKNKAHLPEMNHRVILRDCNEQDLPVMMDIAKRSFVVDRFHSDPHLPNELCDKYYEKWIENSYHGFASRTIVAVYNDEPIGFTTAKVYPDSDCGHLVLSAVSDKYRGLGIYTSMIYEGTRWLTEGNEGISKVLLGTQINTVAVQKAWIKLGYTVYDSSYVLQKYIG